VRRRGRGAPRTASATRGSSGPGTVSWESARTWSAKGGSSSSSPRRRSPGIRPTSMSPRTARGWASSRSPSRTSKRPSARRCGEARTSSPYSRHRSRRGRGQRVRRRRPPVRAARPRGSAGQLGGPARGDRLTWPSACPPAPCARPPSSLPEGLRLRADLRGVRGDRRSGDGLDRGAEPLRPGDLHAPGAGHGQGARADRRVPRPHTAARECSTWPFRTADITQAVPALQDRGVDFLATPSTYYDALAERLGELDHQVSTLRDLSILVDRDHWGDVFQIFTRSTHAKADLLQRGHRPATGPGRSAAGTSRPSINGRGARGRGEHPPRPSPERSARLRLHHGGESFTVDTVTRVRKTRAGARVHPGPALAFRAPSTEAPSSPAPLALVEQVLGVDAALGSPAEELVRSA